MEYTDNVVSSDGKFAIEKHDSKRYDSTVSPSKPIELVPEGIIKAAIEGGVAGQWEGFVERSIFEVDLPDGLGDAWGTSESCPEGTLKISYFHVKPGAGGKGLGTMLLRTYAATAKEVLGYKKLIGKVASYESVKTFMKVFGEDVLTFTSSGGTRVSGIQALEIKRSDAGDKKLDVKHSKSSG